MRELAGYDPVRAEAIYDWPLREALLAYLNHARRVALENWRWARLEWASLKPTDRAGKLRRPPAEPTILKPWKGRKETPDG